MIPGLGLPDHIACNGVWVVNDFLEPLKNAHNDISYEGEVESASLIQFRVVLYMYVLSCFSASIEATFLYTIYAAGPIPPAAVKTNGRV